MRHALAILAAAAACNGSSSVAGDAASSDSDAAIDAGVAPMSITVYDYSPPTGVHMPLPGAMVHFIAPDGTIQVTTTDAAGVARASSPPGSTILSFQPGEGPQSLLLKAFVGASPGDAIIAGHWPTQVFADLGDITFQLPVKAGAVDYDVVVSCSHQITPAALTFRARSCPKAASATAIGWATDGNGQLVSGASVLTNLDLASLVGTTVVMPAYEAGPATVTGEFTRVPIAATSHWEETYLPAGESIVAADASSTPAAPSMPIVGAGDRTISSFWIEQDGVSYRRYQQADPLRVTAFTFDASTLIRGYASVAFDRAIGAVTWRESTGGEPTIVNAIVLVTTPFGTQKFRLDVHGPYDPARSLVLPPLPAELAILPEDRVTVILEFLAIEGRSYRDLLQVVDTEAVSPFYDPTFVGKVWSSS